MNEQMYEVAGILREVGLEGSVRRKIISRCYQRIRDIEAVARQEGRGTRLGTISGNYLEFFNSMRPLLSIPQVTRLERRYKKAQKLWVN